METKNYKVLLNPDLQFHINDPQAEFEGARRSLFVKTDKTALLSKPKFNQNSIELNLRLDYILTARSTTTHPTPPHKLSVVVVVNCPSQPGRQTVQLYSQSTVQTLCPCVLNGYLWTAATSSRVRTVLTSTSSCGVSELFYLTYSTQFQVIF